MNVALQAVAIAALFSSADAGVCQDTRFPSCQALGCGAQNGNGCNEPPECSANGGTVQYAGRTTGVQVDRAPIPSNIAALCDRDTECSAKYTVTLDKQWTTGNDCNDIAMLPPHGIDQTRCVAREADVPASNKRWTGVQLTDFRNHPFPADGIKQSIATAARSVTALTESTINCQTTTKAGNANCAFPLGFKTDTIVKNLGICVSVRNVQDRWVEIMAASVEGSSGASFCVRDRFPGANIVAEAGCTALGDLIDIRESGNRPAAAAANAAANDNMNLIFYAQDNTDDAAIQMYWRIAASYMKPTVQVPGQPAQEKDAEDWSGSRDGAGFPNSLMAPYPNNYNGTPVFERTEGSSASWASPVVQLIFALVAMTAIIL